MEGHTLSDTLNIIYQNLLPIEPDFDIHKCFSHLTFSELALMPIIFEKLTHSYKKRLDLSQDIDVSDEDYFLESQLQDYYSFFKKVTQEHLLLQADYKTNISMYAIFKMMRICDYESTKVLTNDSLLFNDLEEIVDNPNAATVDRRLIKKYLGSECIFQYRNGGR